MKITTCSTSAIVPVRAGLGFASTEHKLGGSAAKVAAAGAVFRKVRRSVMSPPRMEEIEDLPGKSFAHARDRSEIADARASYRAGGAEVLEQRTLAAGADASNFVQGIGADGLGALLAVRADGE